MGAGLVIARASFRPAASRRPSTAAAGRAPRKVLAVYDWIHLRYLGAKGGHGGPWSDEEIATLLEMRSRASGDGAAALKRLVADIDAEIAEVQAIIVRDQRWEKVVQV